jgi:hypothetical protein
MRRRNTSQLDVFDSVAKLFSGAILELLVKPATAERALACNDNLRPDKRPHSNVVRLTIEQATTRDFWIWDPDLGHLYVPRVPQGSHWAIKAADEENCATTFQRIVLDCDGKTTDLDLSMWWRREREKRRKRGEHDEDGPKRIA